MGSLIFYRYLNARDKLLGRIGRLAQGRPGGLDPRLSRLKEAADAGLRQLPQTPGIWRLTTRDGRQQVYRVRDMNGKLYATVGGIAPLAVPVESMPGYWDRAD